MVFDDSGPLARKHLGCWNSYSYSFKCSCQLLQPAPDDFKVANQEGNIDVIRRRNI